MGLEMAPKKEKVDKAGVDGRLTYLSTKDQERGVS